jgi:hypothetical protein
MGNGTVVDQAKPETSISDATLNLRSLAGKVDTTGYPAASSDIVALMVFDHQMRMMNLLTRIGWVVRVGLYEHRLDLARSRQREAIDELVDYLLFVGETPLKEPVQGVSGFTARFPAEGRAGATCSHFEAAVRA